jgi:hypothetical protein
MDRSWLQAFKMDVVSQAEQIQKALFEQYVMTVGELECLSRLEEPAARRAVGSAFLKAIKIRYDGMNVEQIAEKLKEAAVQEVKKRGFGSASSLWEKPAFHPDKLLDAWNEISMRLRSIERRRKRARRIGSVSFLAFMVLLGGLLFGTPTPAHVASTSPQPPSAGPPLPEGTEIPVNLTELHVTEKEAKRYSDFKMGIPSYLPPGYSFDEALVWLRGAETKSDHTLLVYTNAQKHLLRVTYYKLHPNGVISSGVNMPETTTEVYIRGNKGLLVTTRSNFANLDWVENDAYISISGRELDAEELVKMAESLK